MHAIAAMHCAAVDGLPSVPSVPRIQSFTKVRISPVNASHLIGKKRVFLSLSYIYICCMTLSRNIDDIKTTGDQRIWHLGASLSAKHRLTKLSYISSVVDFSYQFALMLHDVSHEF